MELQLISSLQIILITSFSIFISSKIILKIINKTPNAGKLPPGPFRLPLIGNLHNLVGSAPHCRLLELATKYGPLMSLQLGQVPVVVVSSAAVAKEVMKTHDTIFANRPKLLLGMIFGYNCSDIGFAPYGEYWRKLKKICMLELFTSRRVESFRSIREYEVTVSINSLSRSAGSIINLSDEIFSMINRITSRAALGIKDDDQQNEFTSIIHEVIKVAAESGAADMFPSSELIQAITGIKRKFDKMFPLLDAALENIINDHKAKRDKVKARGENAIEEDLVDVLLKIQEDPDSDLPLTANNIKAVLFDIWTAGVETSATTIEWAMSEMLRDPIIMKKAQAEVRHVCREKNGTIDETILPDLSFLKLVIKETLRLHPALPLLLPHESSENCQILGYEIPAKTRAIVNAWAIGRDPDFWIDPDKFKPERFLDTSIDFKGTYFEYIPFGAGRRMCPGILYGLAIVELQLAMFLYHFDWNLPDGIPPEDLDMTETFGISVRRKNPLLLIPIPINN